MTPRISKVRASDEEWALLVHAAGSRGMMKAVEEEAVFKDHTRNMLLNGAGGVDKYKEKNGVITYQRFISICCSINDYLSHIISDDADWPYISQISLIQFDKEEVILEEEGGSHRH